MRRVDLIALLIGIVVFCLLPKATPYRQITNLEELWKAPSGLYIYRGDIINGTLYQGDFKLETYNCESCKGYGDFYITKQGNDLTINKFLKASPLEPPLVVTKSTTTLIGKMYYAEGWVKPNYSNGSPSTIYRNNQYTIGE